MKWVPLAIVLTLLFLAVVGARYIPEKITKDDSNVLEESPVKNAVKTIEPKQKD